MNTNQNTELALFLSSFSPDVQALTLELRYLVLSLVPDAIEQIDRPAKLLAYGFARTYKDMICVIMLQKTYVNLGFPKGAEMSDPAGLLTGTGKRARHVKISDLQGIERPEIHTLIQEAIILGRK